MKESGIKIVATNRSAGRDYFLGDHLEAGIALQGSEIKSVRAGQISLKESFIRVESGQAWLLDAHIAPYQPAARQNHDPRRPRSRGEVRQPWPAARAGKLQHFT